MKKEWILALGIGIFLWVTILFLGCASSSHGENLKPKDPKEKQEKKANKNTKEKKVEKNAKKGNSKTSQEGKNKKNTSSKPKYTKKMVEEGKKLFQKLCFVCHGKNGGGDGPAAAALNPKPRNFQDIKHMKKRSDKWLYTAIKKGGAAVKLSPLMAPFPQLKDKEIKNLIAFIRSLGKEKNKKEKK